MIRDSCNGRDFWLSSLSEPEFALLTLAGENPVPVVQLRMCTFCGRLLPRDHLEVGEEQRRKATFRCFAHEPGTDPCLGFEDANIGALVADALVMLHGAGAP